jgi:hypothetical protein
MRQSGLLVIVAGSLFAAMPALAQGGGNYGRAGFNIADASGDNSLRIGGAAQFTYNASFRDDSVVGQNNDLAVGFENPLTRVRASGTIGTRDLGYKIQLTALSDGGFAIDDAFADYSYGNGVNVRIGQFNLPVLREVVIGAEDRLGSDFSINSRFFGQGYSQGVQVGYTAEQFRIMGALSDGAATDNTAFTSGQEADIALSVRAEGLVIGSNWDQFNNYTSWRGASDNALLVGGALHYQTGGETAGTTEADVLLLTVDGSWEGPGYNITGNFNYRNVDVPGGDTTDFGFLLQGGYFFTDNVEGFARYELIINDDAPAGVDDSNSFLFGGVNYYVFAESNAAKFTGQIGYAFNQTNGLVTAGGPGFELGNALLGQAEDGEFALQLFFQVVF